MLLRAVAQKCRTNPSKPIYSTTKNVKGILVINVFTQNGTWTYLQMLPRPTAAPMQARRNEALLPHVSRSFPPPISGKLFRSLEAKIKTNFRLNRDEGGNGNTFRETLEKLSKHFFCLEMSWPDGRFSKTEDMSHAYMNDFPLSLSLSLTHTHTLTHTRQTHTLSLTLACSCSLARTHTLSFFLSRTFSLSEACRHTHTLLLSFSRTHTSAQNSLSLSHTYSHTHTHIHTHTHECGRVRHRNSLSVFLRKKGTLRSEIEERSRLKRFWR